MARGLFLGARPLHRRARLHLDTDAHAAIGSIRSHLDTEQVIAATLKAVRRGVGAGEVRLWLTTGDDIPVLAVDGGASSEAPHPALAAVPQGVIETARRGRSRHDERADWVAVPLIAPRAGLLAVLEVTDGGSRPPERRFLEDVAEEAALALETAHLYERALAEKEKSEAILARVADAVVVTDPHGEILQWNQAAERLLLHGSNPSLHDGCSDALRLRSGEGRLDCSRGCALLTLADEDGSMGSDEVWRLQPDGRRQPLLASVSTVTDPDGSVSEIVHSFRDVTRLKEADEAKTMFLATASHELRTPLTVIRGFSKLLSTWHDGDEELKKEALDAIERRSIELDRIVERLLLSSRIESGRVEVQVVETDIGRILEERVRSLARAAGRDIALDAGDRVPMVLADADSVATVIDHLLDNAVKYSPEGGPIRVSAAAGGRDVVVEVADAGIGMDDEQAARCFDRFWQGQSSDARQFGGTGIGLYIVRSLVEAMGGRVWVRSTPGEGSRFLFSLNRPDVSSDVEHAPSARSAGGEQSMIREFMRQIGVPQRRNR
ncbi:MAG: ATP-binding protein [Actinomycetota bacterium]